MKETFIKKYWREGDIIFYIHFIGESAVEQVEISQKGIFYTTANNPENDGGMLYDQSLSELELKKDDFISRQEFNSILKKYDLLD